MNFETIMDILSQGEMVYRSAWEPDSFIFLQVPSQISAVIIPNMTSLPQQVKNEFIRRFNDTETFQIDAIYYKDQIAKVNNSNMITGWSPLVEDIYATDWHVYNFVDEDE